MDDLTARIVAWTREDLHDEWVDWRSLTRAARARSDQKPRFSFLSAIRSAGHAVRIIPEIRGSSADGGATVGPADVAALASRYRAGGAAALSVVTEPRFLGGSLDRLYHAGRSSELPVMMRDFVIEPVQIYRGIATGADAVFLHAGILDAARLRDFVTVIEGLGRDAVVGICDEQDLPSAIESGARIVMVMSSPDLGAVEQLAGRLPPGRVTILERGLLAGDPVENVRGFDAVLVSDWTTPEQ